MTYSVVTRLLLSYYSIFILLTKVMETTFLLVLIHDIGSEVNAFC